MTTDLPEVPPDDAEHPVREPERNEGDQRDRQRPEAPAAAAGVGAERRLGHGVPPAGAWTMGI